MNVNVTVELEIILSVFEMPTRVTRVISRRMRTNVLELSSQGPNVQSNKQNGDNLWLLMETNGIGKRDSVLSKIIKS